MASTSPRALKGFASIAVICPFNSAFAEFAEAHDATWGCRWQAEIKANRHIFHILLLSDYQNLEKKCVKIIFNSTCGLPMINKTDPTDDPLNLRRRGSSALMFYFTPLQFVVSGSSDTLSPMSLFRSLPPSKKRFFPWGKITPASVLSCGALNTQRSNLTQNCDVDALFAAQNIHSGLASLCPAHWCKTAAAANATPVDIFGQN